MDMEERDGKSMGYKEAVEFLKEYMQETRKSQTDVAVELGYTGGLLSAFISGKYKTPHTVIPKVEELARIHKKKAVAPKKPDFVETSISRLVTNSIEYARLLGTMTIVYGDAGVGKTWAFEEYMRQNSRALGITLSPTYANIAGVNELLMDRLGIRERVSRMATKEIINKLKGSGRVVIVDEAQHMTVKALDHLRCIADQSDTGLTLIGNKKLHDKIMGGGDEDYAQLFSRICTPAEVRTTMITDEDIRKIFGPYGIDDATMKLFKAVAMTRYGLRGATNVFINAANLFGKIEKEGVVKVIRSMKINA